MKKEEVYSFIVYYMRCIERSNESNYNKMNKVLFLAIYYNIFQHKYDQWWRQNNFNNNSPIREGFKLKDNEVKISEPSKEDNKKEHNDVKISETVDETNKEAHNEAKNTEEKPKNLEKEEKSEEKKIEEKNQVNPKENNIPNKRNKYEEYKNKINARNEEATRSSLVNKIHQCRDIINDVKEIEYTKAIAKEISGCNGEAKNLEAAHMCRDVQLTMKISELEIEKMFYGTIKFSKPIVSIIGVKNNVEINDFHLTKVTNSEEENFMVIYEGVLLASIEYLEYSNTVGQNVEGAPKYYLMNIPFEGEKKITIRGCTDIDEKTLKDKTSFDIKLGEFAVNTSLKDEKSINNYIKIYKESEVVIVLEAIINILMKKIV